MRLESVIWVGRNFAVVNLVLLQVKMVFRPVFLVYEKSFISVCCASFLAVAPAFPAGNQGIIIILSWFYGVKSTGCPSG